MSLRDLPRLRVAALALLALAVPLPALALKDSASPVEPVEIAVSASLGECGLADTQILCRIEASWSAVPGADYYTVSVVRPDGTVGDYGHSSGTAAGLWVPYSGAGTYTVEVAAWGTPDGSAKPRVIARERSLSTPAKRTRSGGAVAAESGAGAPAESGPAEPAASEELESPAPPSAEPPCDEAASETARAAGEEDPAAAAAGAEEAAAAEDPAMQPAPEADDAPTCP